jgi:predicted ATPase
VAQAQVLEQKLHGAQGGGKQPQRDLYLRTLASLASPSEVRSILQMGNQDFQQQELNADLIAFAHRVLPFKYRGVKLLTIKGKDLLFANREDSQSSYSEFHMSAGERALLRISKDISRLKNALILIDEIEAGLHPFTQQQVMLELQRLALRNNLQIIVTSHSSVVLESVPAEGRIFFGACRRQRSCSATLPRHLSASFLRSFATKTFRIV